MNGIDLGTKIREAAPPAKIVFVTTHAELAHLTFKHKIGAQDYIVKDRPNEIKARIDECIASAYKQYQKEKHEQMKCFKVDAGAKYGISPTMIFYFSKPM